MKFACDFLSRTTNERRTIVVDLSASELEEAQKHEWPEVCRQAMALRHAYAMLPKGVFGHVAPPRLLQ